MKLLVVSAMPHYLDADGRVYGWGPTVEELDHLAGCFSEVRHIAVLHPELPPESCRPYAAPNLRTVLLPARGGRGFGPKVALLATLPRYVFGIVKELRRKPDVVHVRSPANVSMISLPLVRMLHKGPCWVKYAGNWRATGDALSYRLQRGWLRRGFGGSVTTVNGEWADSPDHVVAFRNPSLTTEDLKTADDLRSSRPPIPPIRLLFVGRVETPKGVGTVLQIAASLRDRQVDFDLAIIGDGPERAAFQHQRDGLELEQHVRFLGWLPKSELFQQYAMSHVILLPSTAAEGWPKVLSEAMAHGAVPIASAISSIPQVLAETRAGVAIGSSDPDDYVAVIERMVSEPAVWEKASDAGIRSAPAFGYAAYLAAVRVLFADRWDLNLRCH